MLGESCISCELKLAGPEYECHPRISSLSAAVAEELFRFELSDRETRSQALTPDLTKLKKATVVVDNSLSPAHTLLQLHCVDHKSLFYDVLRTLKDYNIKVFSIFLIKILTFVVIAVNSLSFPRFPGARILRDTIEL